jgi:hypothetical protein
MHISADDSPVLSEQVWLGWIHKKKLRQQAMVRKCQRLAGIALGLLAIGVAIYFIAPK